MIKCSDKKYITPLPVIIIMGPTGSGKSRLAVDLALSLQERRKCLIINADSIQLYKDIPILSAQPSLEEVKKIPHALYGFLESEQSYTAALWVEQATLLLKRCQEQETLPLIVGGTGFYLKGLVEGFSAIPFVPPAVRAHATDFHDTIGPEKFYQEVEKVDPQAAARLHPHDRQRLIRVWEVFHASQKTLSYWQSQPKISSTSFCSFFSLYLNPNRSLLYQRVDQRFLKMIEEGAVEEVQQLINKHIPKTSPVFRALGAVELASYIERAFSLDQAIEHSQQMTHHYIKRQQTWFRHQLPIMYEINNFYRKEALRSIESMLKGFYSGYINFF